MGAATKGHNPATGSPQKAKIPGNQALPGTNWHVLPMAATLHETPAGGVSVFYPMA